MKHTVQLQNEIHRTVGNLVILFHHWVGYKRRVFNYKMILKNGEPNSN